MMLRTPRRLETHATTIPEGAATRLDGKGAESAWSMVRGGCWAIAQAAAARRSRLRLNGFNLGLLARRIGVRGDEAFAAIETDGLDAELDVVDGDIFEG